MSFCPFDKPGRMHFVFAAEGGKADASPLFPRKLIPD